MSIELLTRQRYCNLCNEPVVSCRCPKNDEKGVITQIIEKMTQKRKKFTVVYGGITHEDYSLIKQLLGTGGTYAPDVCTFRGEMKKRLMSLLRRQGYTLLEERGL